MSSDGPTPHVASRRRTWLEPLAVVVVLVAVAVALFRFTGGRWMSVATPSMALAAPVGTLALTRPTTAADVAVGDLIVFDAPGRGEGRYLHRVVRIDPDAGLHTRGDLNGAEDPWTVRDPDLVGRVTLLLPGAGWILELLPILLVGGLTLVFLVHTYVPRPLRAPTLTVGFSVVVAVALWVVRPLVRAATITRTVVDGTLTTELVPTGLLPVRATVTGGGTAILEPGELGRLSGAVPGPDGDAAVLLAPHLTPAWWVVCVLVSIAPSVVCIGWALRGGRSPAAVGPAARPVAGASVDPGRRLRQD